MSYRYTQCGGCREDSPVGQKPMVYATETPKSPGGRILSTRVSWHRSLSRSAGALLGWRGGGGGGSQPRCLSLVPTLLPGASSHLPTGSGRTAHYCCSS